MIPADPDAPDKPLAGSIRAWLDELPLGSAPLVFGLMALVACLGVDHGPNRGERIEIGIQKGSLDLFDGTGKALDYAD